MLTAVAALLLAKTGDETELVRTYVTGQTQTYEFKSHILSEQKSAAMSFFLPEEFDVNYGFTIKVDNAKQDGFAETTYERPVMNFIEGETADHPPKTKVEKVGWKYKMTLSPINRSLPSPPNNVSEAPPAFRLHSSDCTSMVRLLSDASEASLTPVSVTSLSPMR